VVLLACTILALAWANSPWAASYEALLETRITVAAGAAGLSKPLLLWINDGLMAIFFFLIGLEIKREILVGELSSPREAALPIAAALGGMVVPATIFAVLNAGRETAVGWGIPMATDIAFALGVLALLGRHLPPSLRVFLAALAIVDDLGAVLVIAVFYTTGVSFGALAVAGAFFLLLTAANAAGVRSPVVYGLLGVALWAAMLSSGVHATIAGVLVSLTVPATSRLEPLEFMAEVRRLLHAFDHAGDDCEGVLANEERLATVQAIEKASERVETPLQRFEHTLEPWVTFAVMPSFALANAGVALSGDAAASALQPLGLGVFFGLLVGKPLGITLFSLVAVKLRLGSLPSGITPRHILGVGFLGGIGFTMALFIANMAFTDPATVATAKVAVLAASLLAGTAGVGILLAARHTDS
jgi:NhaA family Na+:H+ antiporter